MNRTMTEALIAEMSSKNVLKKSGNREVVFVEMGRGYGMEAEGKMGKQGGGEKANMIKMQYVPIPKMIIIIMYHKHIQI